MTASAAPDGHQGLSDDLRLVPGLLSDLRHVNLPGGIPSHAPMMPQPPVELKRSVYTEVRT